jgi:hypothetical protein
MYYCAGAGRVAGKVVRRLVGVAGEMIPVFPPTYLGAQFFLRHAVIDGRNLPWVKKSMC